MPPLRWLWQCDCVVPSEPGACRRILDGLLAEMAARDWRKHDLYSVRLAAEEALANAVRHGNGADGRKRIRIRCRLGSRRVRVGVRDQGQGFDPTMLPDPTGPDRLEVPNGRGVMLMQAYMSRVRYNAVGNCVIMDKTRDHAL